MQVVAMESGTDTALLHPETEPAATILFPRENCHIVSRAATELALTYVRVVAAGPNQTPGERESTLSQDNYRLLSLSIISSYLQSPHILFCQTPVKV